MSITVTECLENSSYELINPGFENGRADVRTVYRATRYFKVDGLDKNATLAARSIAAAGASEIPQPQEEYPGNAFLWVTSVSVKCVGVNNAFVTVEYNQKPDADLPAATMDVGAVTTQLESEYDYKGDHLKLTVGGADYFGRYPTEWINPIVRISKTGFAAITALNEVKTYNNTVCNGGPLGGGPRTWRTTVTTRPSGLGNTYTIDWEFAYDPGTWDMYCAYFDPTGKQLTPDKVPSANKRVQRYWDAGFPPNAMVAL